MPDAPDSTSDPADSTAPDVNHPRRRKGSPYLLGIGVLAVALTLAAGFGVALWWMGSVIEHAISVSKSGGVPTVIAVDESFDLTGLTVQLSQGGLGKDGVPAITDPAIVAIADAEAWPEDARIVGVEINGETRGYPLAILNWHECINDTLGGVPIAVTFCPLCDSVSVVDRRLPGRSEPVEFGISGMLTNSNLLLYDRVDDSLWSQVKLEAISGPNVGRSLDHLTGWEISRWNQWRAEHPEATVVQPTLAPEHQRDYSAEHFTAYIETDRLMFPIVRDDDRLPRKTKVVGVRQGDETRAWPIAWIAAQSGGRVSEAWGGGTVELQADAGGGVEVVAVPHGAAAVHTFWFAWAAFHPHTSLAE